MIITVRTPEGTVPIEQTDFRPRPVGEFLLAAISRRHLSVETVSKQTALTVEELRRIFSGDLRLDKTICHKLQKVFPHTKNVLMRMQDDYDFFTQNGFLRPSNELRPKKARQSRTSAS